MTKTVPIKPLQDAMAELERALFATGVPEDVRSQIQSAYDAIKSVIGDADDRPERDADVHAEFRRGRK